MQKIAIALVALVLVAGCVGTTNTTTTTTTASEVVATTAAPTTTVGPVKTFTMLVTHSGYSEKVLNLNLGDHVVINARTDIGTEAHNHGIAIDELGVNKAVAATDINNPTVIEFDATKVGTFKMYCGTCKDGIYGANHPQILGEVRVTQ